MENDTKNVAPGATNKEMDVKTPSGPARNGTNAHSLMEN